jgi:hypothetical protein
MRVEGGSSRMLSAGLVKVRRRREARRTFSGVVAGLI